MQHDWVERFKVQATACGALGSQMYARLLHLIAADVEAGGATWKVLEPHRELRYGQAGPLRLVAAAHLLALNGEAPGWAAILPSCGGTVPLDDRELRSAWLALVEGHGEQLGAAMANEVQTNEVARSAGLALALAATGFGRTSLIEIGCSGGLNLRLDHYCTRLDLPRPSARRTVEPPPEDRAFPALVLGDRRSAVRLEPQIGEPGATGGIASAGMSASLRLPVITDRIGIDPDPIDPTTPEGRSKLLSFIWPDQLARLARVSSAIEVATRVPASLARTRDTVSALDEALQRDGARVVQHSIVWQYIPTDMRWAITSTMERLGSVADDDSPLAWIRYEPDEWNRTRAAIWLRTWPTGGDRLVAHVDFHGRWIAPIT